MKKNVKSASNIIEIWVEDRSQDKLSLLRMYNGIKSMFYFYIEKVELVGDNFLKIELK